MVDYRENEWELVPIPYTLLDIFFNNNSKLLWRVMPGDSKLAVN